MNVFQPECIVRQGILPTSDDCTYGMVHDWDLKDQVRTLPCRILRYK